MRRIHFMAVINVLVYALTPDSAFANGPMCPTATRAASDSAVSRTPWGDPDLQGVWSGAASVLVPFDRDPSLGSRNVMTEEEFRARLARQLKAASSGNIEATNFGIEPDLAPATSRQASLVVEVGRLEDRKSTR